MMGTSFLSMPQPGRLCYWDYYIFRLSLWNTMKGISLLSMPWAINFDTGVIIFSTFTMEYNVP